MSDRTPKVGDAAIIDGQNLKVAAVNPGGKTVVKMCCPNAMARARANAKVRAKYAKPREALDAKFAKAMLIERASARRMATMPLKVESEALNEKLTTELSAIPRGTTVGANPRDLEWVEVANAWSVRGRLLSYADRMRARGRRV